MNKFSSDSTSYQPLYGDIAVNDAGTYAYMFTKNPNMDESGFWVDLQTGKVAMSESSGRPRYHMTTDELCRFKFYRNSTLLREGGVKVG